MLGQWDEQVGGDGPVLGVVPAGQCLRSDGSPRSGIDLGLENHEKFTVLDRLAEVSDEGEPAGGVLVVGGLLTYIFARVAWDSLWLLPGLWTILFGMGILASRQLLPRIPSSTSGTLLTVKAWTKSRIFAGDLTSR